ncbi:amino acid ABC transporter permease [Pseudogracilibacillus auburnensis]|uniref:Amino acid ABC transporter membrane protein (PAAT family) n=1 Tax=Pseudogracilibacillus auburnensis TaxID=1494959 RepID=A0A2V3W7R6_9BACI|nr:amino acid ABC transporter permease [Pseudogracilibacillus auburnensis]MBO1005438.1 amino acid ABC transporter permease [Pseudogracilibacillus auburnensis]PXW90377.1 amino acid ABC transporter membrane protein (PAAT family) [Pseudogracilibacillus auburnensis]
MEHIIKVLPYLLEGIKYTFLITIVGVALGFVIGAFAGLGRLSKSKIIYWLCTTYVEIIRGTPILVQILFIYFGLSDLLGINLDKVTASIIAIAINAGAYIAEIVRGGVQSIDKGQFEAGDSIGLTKRQTMWYIIWPQALKRMIPPLGNQFIISLKDTSLFSAIAVGEVLYQGKAYTAAAFTYFEPYLMVAVFYLAITIPASIILRRVERRLDV